MNRISGFVILLLGMGILWQGKTLKMGTFKTPGPGLFPFILATILIILSLFLIIPKGKKECVEKLSLSWSKNVKQLVLVYVFLLAYFFFLQSLGFMTAGFLLMTFLFTSISSLRWYIAVPSAFISIGASYLIFEVLLKSYLPKGVLGF